ncbi:MAG: formylglycine-generating enzyme family protein, partial [Planctomycetota bacterium]
EKTRLSPYFMSKFEMTQGQWKRLTGRNPSAFGPDAPWGYAAPKPDSLLHPVEQVSWQACHDCLNRAALSLPSQAQWEYATRAGTSTKFSTGDTNESLQGAANFRDEHVKAIEYWVRYPAPDDGSAVHWVVGSGAPNRWGLHDVHGNVSEWCLDGLPTDGETYAKERVDPVIPTSTDLKYVIRGGSWRSGFRDLQSRGLHYYPPQFFGSGLGVRPARAIDP